MDNILSSYILSSVFMIAVLAILAVRSFSALEDKTSRKFSLLLIGGTILYVIVDAVFIACHLSGHLTVSAWKIVSFVFYFVYTILPFIWHLFVRNFVGRSYGKVFRMVETIPIIILLGMLVLTPSTGALYYFDADGMYQRGTLYNIYAYLNFFYYAESIIDLLVISIKKTEKEERYAVSTMVISFVVLIGSFLNNNVIPQGTIFPFMPFCSTLVAMLAFYFVATKDAERSKEYQQQLVQDALEKAQEASQAKTEFLSRMSHDIRTPMNAVINLTDLALQEPISDTVREYLEKSMVSSKFLLGLINDILDMSRIESGTMVMKKENLTRTDFLNAVETVVMPLVREKNINFHGELNPGEYTISVDKLRFYQIFFNLLSNAVKFTPEGGDVWFTVENLEVENDKLRIRFSVRDNGIGMSEEFQEHLFEPFAQEHSELSAKTTGTGLGLPIVKSLVDAMDGTISVKSKLGEGTEISVVMDVDIVARAELLPSKTYASATATESAPASADSASATASSPATATESAPASADSAPASAVDSDSTSAPASASTSASTSTSAPSVLKGLNVLLVEDNEINTYVARIILENGGCVVSEANNGEKAVEAFSESEPYTYDAILMDVRMPIMDGLEATKAIRALDRPDAVSVPIIAMTADAFDDERLHTIEAGMNYHLTKPIETDQLYEALRLCCSKSKKDKDEQSK